MGEPEGKERYQLEMLFDLKLKTRIYMYEFRMNLECMANIVANKHEDFG